MHKLFHSNYYEAIIQLRPYKKEILDFIVNQISKRKDIFISKKEDLKTGVDIYISSQKFARSLGEMLKRRFKGDLKITKSIYKRDRQTSRDLYRATVLFRLKE